MLDKLDPGLASLLLTWIELMGVVGFPDRLRLREAVMTAAMGGAGAEARAF